MNVVLSIVAQLLHIAVIVVAAPLLTGLAGTIGGYLSGHAAPPILRPVHDIVRLFRKQPIRTQAVSVLTRVAPLLSAVLAALIAVLIPSFALGMVSAPLADVLTIAGLFAFGRILLVLAAMDAGTGAGGFAATETTALAMLAEPALLLGVFALALLGGSSLLDTILAVRQEGLLPANPAAALAVAALALLGWAERERPSLDAGFSGRDLAVLRIADQLRLLAWCDLIGALALPFGMAAAEAGPLSWGIGLLAWIGRLFLSAAILAVAGASGASHRIRAIVALALALGGVAALLGLTNGGAA